MAASVSRVLVVADSAGSAAGYAALLAGAGHEPWTAVGPAEVASLALECAPGVALIALDAPSSELRSLIQRVRGAVERPLPVVLALPDSAWWLRAPPSAELAPVAVVRRAGLTSDVFEGALERLSIGPARAPVQASLALDATRRRLTGPAGTARLTPAEGALVATLLGAPGALADLTLLCGAIWPGDPPDEHRIVALRTHVYALRRKLAAVGAEDALVTEPGRGYRLVMS